MKGKAAPQAPLDQSGREVRRGAMRAIGAELPPLTKRLCRRRGFADGGMIVDWPRIVGLEIAKRSRPLRISYPTKGERREGTLLLRTSSGFALDLQHLSPLLIERINGYFGYQAVAKITFQQGYIPPLHEDEEKALPAEPTPEALHALSEKLKTVEDPKLRAALDRLGRTFHGSNATTPGEGS